MMIGARCPATARPRRAAVAAAPVRARPSSLVRRGPLPPRSGGGGAVAPELRAEIEALLSEHRVVLFMKGTKSFPMCGFSGTCVQILKTVSVGGAELPFHTVNVLERDDLRTGMKEYSQWPTFPQVYIDGEFFGGCDIMLGELDRLSGGLVLLSFAPPLEVQRPAHAPASPPPPKHPQTRTSRASCRRRSSA
jgi:monothiol glutaredoxin